MSINYAVLFTLLLSMCFFVLSDRYQHLSRGPKPCCSQENNLLYDFNYGFGFVHRLDVASSGLILAARTFDGLICLQWQKALCAIDSFLALSLRRRLVG